MSPIMDRPGGISGTYLNQDTDMPIRELQCSSHIVLKLSMHGVGSIKKEELRVFFVISLSLSHSHDNFDLASRKLGKDSQHL